MGLNDLFIPNVYDDIELLCDECLRQEGYWVATDGSVCCQDCGIITGKVTLYDVLDDMTVPDNWLFLVLNKGE